MENLQREMTAKQKKFCDLVLQGLNATRAALRAGYSRTTAENGCLMNMPKIRKYLAEHSCEQNEGEVLVSHDMVLQQLCKVAFASIGDCFYPDGTLKSMDDIGPDTLAAVESISFSAGGSVKIKMYNKMAALEKIAKRTGFYVRADQAKPIAVASPTADALIADQDDDFDLPLVVQEAEDYMAGKTSDSEEFEEDARIKTQEFLEDARIKTQESRNEGEFVESGTGNHELRCLEQGSDEELKCNDDKLKKNDTDGDGVRLLRGDGKVNPGRAGRTADGVYAGLTVKQMAAMIASQYADGDGVSLVS